MKRLLQVAPLAALAALLVATPDANAFVRRRQCAEECAPAYSAPCAPMSVTWVEQEVTAYRVEWRTREVPVEVMVATWVPKKETIEEMVATWVPKKETIEERVATWVPKKET